MKKYLILGLVLSALLVTPVLAQTSSVDQMIQQLRQQIAELTAKLQQLLGQRDQTSNDRWCHDFSRDLRIGDRGDEVYALYRAVYQDLSGNIPNDYLNEFNENLASQIVALQEKYADDILKPIGLAHGTGYVGKATRARLNQLFGCGRTVIHPILGRAFITPQALPVGVINNSYSAKLQAHYNDGARCAGTRCLSDRNWTFSVTDGQLPPGLSLRELAIYPNNQVYISDTPTQAGSYDFVVEAKSDDGIVATQKYTIRIKGEASANRPPVINSVSGPTTLDVGQTGTWTINATDPENGTLNYSVAWGDEVSVADRAGQSLVPSLLPQQQTATFSHGYSQAGVYYIYFGVIDDVGGRATKLLTVRVGNITTPSITVLSPNGGENWVSRSVQPITWRVTRATARAKVDLYLRSECLADAPCPTLAGPEYILDKNIAWNARYNWIVATDINDRSIPAGQYRVLICSAGTLGDCDFSDSPFTITNPVSTNLPPVISGISGPTTLNVNQTGTWTINATDPEDGPLTYAVSWGDGVPVALERPDAGLSATAFVQNAGFTHAYAADGNYTVIFVVKDPAGDAAKGTITVRVQ